MCVCVCVCVYVCVHSDRGTNTNVCCRREAVRGLPPGRGGAVPLRGPAAVQLPYQGPGPCSATALRRSHACRSSPQAIRLCPGALGYLNDFAVGCST